MRRVRITYVAHYEICDEDLETGGCYTDERNPGPLTFEEAVELDRQAIQDGIVSFFEITNDRLPEDVTLELLP